VHGPCEVKTFCYYRHHRPHVGARVPVFTFRTSRLVAPQYISMKLNSQWYFGSIRQMCPASLIMDLMPGSVFSSSWKSARVCKQRRRQQYSRVSGASSGRESPVTVSHLPLHARRIFFPSRQPFSSKTPSSCVSAHKQRGKSRAAC
jgi:hypothetical protein